MVEPSSGCQLVTEALVVLVVVVHDLVTETVVVKLSGCQLVMMVLVVHDDGWQQHYCLVLSSTFVPGQQPA